jgi:hypothetical protein
LEKVAGVGAEGGEAGDHRGGGHRSGCDSESDTEDGRHAGDRDDAARRRSRERAAGGLSPRNQRPCARAHWCMWDASASTSVPTKSIFEWGE